MEKKEFKVGEVFQCGLIKMQVEIGRYACNGCYFEDMGICLTEMTGECLSTDREDNESVIFVKVDD